MMTGMNRSTGARLDGIDHLKQSVWDILTTPIGTRVMRRDYGSEVPNVIDKPINAEIIVDVFAAAADAIDKWEPRFKLKQLAIPEARADGRVGLELKGIWYPDWPRREGGREVEVLL